MKRNLIGILLPLMAITFFSCNKDSFEKQRQEELKRLNQFISNNYTNEQPKQSGLYYITLDEGTGDSINIGDRVLFYFNIKTLEGDLRIQTSGYTDGYRYNPVSVIVQPPTQLSSSPDRVESMLALHEALTYMREGSRSLLIFDSSLGFGQHGTSGISGFSSLLMEVEVEKVYHPQ